MCAGRCAAANGARGAAGSSPGGAQQVVARGLGGEGRAHAPVVFESAHSRVTRDAKRLVQPLYPVATTTAYLYSRIHVLYCRILVGNGLTKKWQKHQPYYCVLR